MPAYSSSLISAALGHLADVPNGDREGLLGRLPDLLEYLAWVPDPRDPRGVRHTLVSLLGLAAAAVLSGAQGFTAIGEWVLDASPHGQALHLLSVLNQAAWIVLNQTGVQGKTNEITRFRPLLESVDLVGAVVTADALASAAVTPCAILPPAPVRFRDIRARD